LEEIAAHVSYGSKTLTISTALLARADEVIE
jgi:hypothetical protein